jgi:hypothetical protein
VLSEPVTLLAGIPVQRTVMVLGGVPAWMQLLVVLCGWLPVAVLAIGVAASLVIRTRLGHAAATTPGTLRRRGSCDELALTVAAGGLSLSAALLAVAHLLARPLYFSAVAPGMLPPETYDLMDVALDSALQATLRAASVVVLAAAAARLFIPRR